MQTIDAFGLSHTTENPLTLEQFQRVTESYLSSLADTMSLLDRLLDQESLPLAVCFRGYLMKMGSDPRLDARIQETIENLRDLSLNHREQMHLSVLESWSRHQSDAAIRQIEELLEEYPRDLLALRIAHHLHFYTGDSDAMCASVGQRLKYWNEEDPCYGFVLGMHSFGLEEAADYREAEIAGRRAIELNPSDIWAGHAMAHVFQMQGRWVDGVRWMTAMLPHWSSTNNFCNHLHWHYALFCLGRSRIDDALAIYDTHLAGAVSDDFYLDACNASALLWRLDMAGVDTGGRWHALHEKTAHRMSDNELVFCKLHYLMPAAVLGETEQVQTVLQEIEAWSHLPTPQGSVCHEVGLKLARAIAALGQSDTSGARLIAEARRDIRLIGGSWAQRDLFRQLQSHYGESR